jgi:hypothetical protein
MSAFKIAMRSVLCVIGFVMLCVMIVSQSEAKGIEVKSTTQRVVQGMCGSGIQSGNGHTGCSICTAKNCADYDCSKKGCTITVFIKGKPGTTRTGVTGTKAPIDMGTGNGPPRHPVNIGTGTNPVVSSGSNNPQGKGGGMSSGGGYRR